MDEFWSQNPGPGKNNLMTLKTIHEVVDGFLVLVEGINNLGTFPLSDEINIRVACTTLTPFWRKVRYVGKLKWDRMSKYPKALRTFYETGDVGKTHFFL